MKKVLFVVGSTRKESFHRQLAEFLKGEVEKTGNAAEILNYEGLPFFSQDIEFPTPEVVKNIRSKFAESDALWILSPEYNGSYSGTLKNLLDWVSRPVDPAVQGAPEFIKGKPVTISGAAGRSKAAFVIENLKNLATYMGFKVAANNSGINIPGESWGTNVLVLGEEEKALLTKQVEDFIKEL
ncbi:NADPH-dependent FMN reductase [Streptobacillus canis]|uniref:NADPH-dependent FMN reductase n=1 Tax=Streptobacillus canis TaxID=2678686 RepID=UPI0012E209AA|nr:NADPH-dependent FMN reductase [Streptobacillus canis]